MPEEHAHKHKTVFKIGIALIALNYVLWASSFVFAGLAVKWPGFPWVRVAAVAFVLSWVLFGLGFILAGPSAIRHVRHVVIRWLKKHRKPDEPEPQEETQE